MAVKAGLTERMKKHVWMPEMKGLRKILLVSWTAKKTNEWVLNKAGVNRELLDTVKARKLAYYGHTMRKQGSCLEKRYDTRCYINVRSKADINRLNLPHGDDN